jgi:hypothetical protein
VNAAARGCNDPARRRKLASVKAHAKKLQERLDQQHAENDKKQVDEHGGTSASTLNTNEKKAATIELRCLSKPGLGRAFGTNRELFCVAHDI